MIPSQENVETEKCMKSKRSTLVMVRNLHAACSGGTLPSQVLKPHGYLRLQRRGVEKLSRHSVDQSAIK